MDNSPSITPPAAPMIPGLTFRRFRGADDFPNIAAVINASLIADESKERITAEDLINLYEHPAHWDPQQDILLVEVDGKLIGYANMEWRLDDRGDCLHMIDLYLLPAWRGGDLELAMQRHMEGCIRPAVTPEFDGLPHWFVSKVPETWPTRIEMLRGSGYAPVRWYFEMQRPLLGGSLPEMLLPPGLAIRPPNPEHYCAIWEAGEECFRDQQEYVALSEADYQAWVATPGLDPSLWLVAWDGDQLAGAAINVIHPGDWGETDDLFVRRPWRKQGLGRALLAGSLHLFKARGLCTWRRERHMPGTWVWMLRTFLVPWVYMNALATGP
ncbi:MAG TPA: GNAT family N-acetyltransferase, partial [Anaerolineales bacterium]|nr:GNAT family N-acetyltransferase [Anaerolineales bacterium]